MPAPAPVVDDAEFFREEREYIEKGKGSRLYDTTAWSLAIAALGVFVGLVAGLAVGLALQGSQANFASGFLMIIFLPFKVCDFIEAAGGSGSVEAIQIFTTTLKTPDNKTVIVPNSAIYDGNITNYSAKETRRVDLVVGVSYDADLSAVKAILKSACIRAFSSLTRTC